MSAIIEPFFICLIASMIWAPLVFLLAARLNEKEASAFADKLWPTALFIAAAPALFAPFAAAMGLSLRNPAPLPPMAEPTHAVRYVPVAEPLIAQEPVQTVKLAEILEAMAALYFYGFVLFFALGVVRMVWFSYRVGYAFELDEPRLRAGLETWRRRMNINPNVRYAFTDAVSSVCVHGFFRPVILMPMNLLDRVSVDDAILMGAHEMAHIKRGDTCLFAFATAMKAVFWFNPFIHRIAARANLAAEQAADALVIARGAGRREYARCFVEGLRFAAGAPRPEYALVPSFTPFDKRSRRERLDAILSGAAGVSLLNFSSKIGLALSVLFASAIALAQAALAVTPHPAKDALPNPPIEGEVEITLGFGKKVKSLGPDRPAHEGVDILAVRGTPVHAAGGGKVISASNRYKGSDAWGNMVVIDHGHGLVTRYAHLDSYSVRKGDRVSAGEVIGAVGSTGKVTGPHLHFEVLKDGAPIDPSPVAGVKSAARVSPPMKTARTITHAAPVIAAAPAPLTEPSPETLPEPESLPAAPETPQLDPAPVIIGEIAVAPEAPEVDETVEAKLERKLAGKYAKWNDKFRNNFKNFEDYIDASDLAIELSEVEFENMNEFVEQMEAFNFHFDGMEGFEVEIPEIAFAYNGRELTDEQKAEIREAQKRAKREAERAMHEARKNIERASKQMEAQQRARQRALERAHEQRIRAQEQRKQAQEQRKHAIKQREHAQKQRERAMEQAQIERERALQDAERKRERAMELAGQRREEVRAEAERLREKEIEQTRQSHKDMLQLREDALNEAQEQLERERDEIERMREDLEEELSRLEEEAYEDDDDFDYDDEDEDDD